jgi:hypothetical protein
MMASLVLARGGMPVASGLHFSRRPNTAAAKSRPTNRTEPLAIVRSHLYRRQKQPQVITNLFREKHVRYAG